MSAASSPAPAPLFVEGSKYWEDLITECKRQTEAINSVVSEAASSGDYCVHCTTSPELRMFKPAYPSTTVKAFIGFYSWGPMISLAVIGHETSSSEFFPEECELPLAIDLDGEVVAIFQEGRSFSPRELAAYFAQSFRRCFPAFSLRC